MPTLPPTGPPPNPPRACPLTNCNS
jgi:hypothetical protein